MLEILQFVFSGFWTFLGTLILFAIGCQAAVAMFGLLVMLIRGK